MIIGLSGYASSGKDTVAKVLVEQFGFTRIAFADPIRELLYTMDPMVWGQTYEGGQSVKEFVDEVGWDIAKQHHEVRRLLQTLGYSARHVLGDDVWIIAAMRKMRDEINYVVTDVRFLNEADLLRHELDAQLWRVERPGYGPVNEHVSEWQLNGYEFDRILNNDGTLEELEFMIKTFNVNKGI
jgi:dephospho-CoA kinase